MLSSVNAKSQTSVASTGGLNAEALGFPAKDQVLDIWKKELSNWPSSNELANHVAKTLSIDLSLIQAWRILDRWPEPSTKSSLKRFVGGFEEDDPCEWANDPLDAYYDTHMQAGNRRPVLNYLQNAGFLRPSEVDLEIIQDTLDRFPVTLRDLSAFLCLEPGIFEKYALARGVKEAPHAYLKVPIHSLLFQHDYLMGIACAHAQHLYRHRGVPIRIIASRMKIQWKDLWLLGVQKGYWQPPSQETFAELDELFYNRKS